MSDLVIKQGTTAKWSLRLANEYGVAIDLSNVEFRGQVRTTYNSNLIAATFNFEILDAPNGALYMSLNPTDTEKLTTTKYVYDVEATEPSGSTSGSVYRILEGTVTVRPRVTI